MKPTTEVYATKILSTSDVEFPARRCNPPCRVPTASPQFRKHSAATILDYSCPVAVHQEDSAKPRFDAASEDSFLHPFRTMNSAVHRVHGLGEQRSVYDGYPHSSRQPYIERTKVNLQPNLRKQRSSAVHALLEESYSVLPWPFW